MYAWRKMDDAERGQVLKLRKRERVPHHAPPGGFCTPGFYIINAACYEHGHIMDSLERRLFFARELRAHVQGISRRVHAWVVLPNHYHILAEIGHPIRLRSHMGQLHGRISKHWNQLDGTPGRKVWYQSFERPLGSSGHYYTSLNYIHNNPIKHGYSSNWLDWEASSFKEFIAEVGRDRAIEIWRAYPIKDYGESIEGKSGD